MGTGSRARRADVAVGAAAPKLQDAGKSVELDIQPKELDDYIDAIPNPKGLLLCIPSEDAKHELANLKRVSSW